MENHYHDSLDERTRLDEFEHKAKKQDILVQQFMKAHAGQAFTPPEVWRAVDPDDTLPLTSIRRAMTNMSDPEKGGCLVHQKDKKKIGLYGRVNDTWVYPANYVQAKLF